MKLKVMGLLDLTKMGMETGSAKAVRLALQQQLGSDLEEVRLVRPVVMAEIKVKPDTDLERLRNPSAYQTMYPALIDVWFEEIEHFSGQEPAPPGSPPVAGSAPPPASPPSVIKSSNPEEAGVTDAVTEPSSDSVS